MMRVFLDDFFEALNGSNGTAGSGVGADFSVSLMAAAIGEVGVAGSVVGGVLGAVDGGVTGGVEGAPDVGVVCITGVTAGSGVAVVSSVGRLLLSASIASMAS